MRTAKTTGTGITTGSSNEQNYNEEVESSTIAHISLHCNNAYMNISPVVHVRIYKYGDEYFTISLVST